MEVHVVVLFCLTSLVTAQKADECKWTEKGMEYRSTVDKTSSGLTCQRWDSQSPHTHSYTTLENNYCRNPSASDDLWCYTTSADKRWEYCAVPFCNPVMDHWLPLQRGRVSGVKLTKLSVNSKSLWIVDANFNSYVMHDDQGFTHVQSSIRDLSANEDYGLWMTTSSYLIWYRRHISESNPAGSSHAVVDGGGVSISTGRRGIVIVLGQKLLGNGRKGISTSTVMGSSWYLTTGTAFNQMSCGFRQCAAVVTNGSMAITSQFPETDSPTIDLWYNVIHKNITEVAAYGDSSLWVVDKNGIALQAINFQGNNFINANWEPRGYHDSAKANFMEMTVTDKLAFGMAKGDGDIYVLTGCPIFDFETESYPKHFWAVSGDAEKYQPSHGTDHTSGALVGKVGGYLIDTGSKNVFSSAPTDSTKNGLITGTITLPEFEIYKDTLHFLVGGGPTATNYVALLIDDEEKRTASGGSKIFEAFGKKYTMARMWWDVTEFKGKCAKVKIVDNSAEASSDWGFTMFDDLRSAPPCYQGMNIKVSYFPSDKVAGIGDMVLFKLDLNGFYVSPDRPLVFEAAVDVENGYPLMYFSCYFAGWTKATCKDGLKSINAKKTCQSTSIGHHKVKMEIHQLWQSATYELLLKVLDHKNLIAPSVNIIPAKMTVTASQGEFFMAKETRTLKLRRTGREKVVLKEWNGVLHGIKNYAVGENFILKVEFYHNFWTSKQRAYNILTRLKLPPYLSLVSVRGIRNDEGDILYNATTSEKVIKVNELVFENSRSFFFTIKVIGNPRWNIRDNKMFDGLFILDVSYCVRRNCTDVDNKQTEISSLIKDRRYSFKFYYNHPQPVRPKSMEGFTTIVDKTGSLTFICGPYEELSVKVRHNCYYNNATVGTWKGLSPFLSNISFYDSANKELYGTNKKGVNMKFYGDYFQQHYCLSDEDWNIITASSASFSTPLTVDGLFNTTANGIDGILSGGNGYQHAVNGNGGMSRDFVSSPWKGKLKWRCCL